MTLTRLVTIMLRFFALYWLVQGLSQLVWQASLVRFQVLIFANLWGLVAPGVTMLAALGLFVYSQPLARRLTPPPHVELQLGGLTRHDLYCFAFTFLGLYFMLYTLANATSWVHYAVQTSRMENGETYEQQPAFYQFTETFVTLVAGGTCLLFASKLARKLAKFQGRGEEV